MPAIGPPAIRDERSTLVARGGGDGASSPATLADLMHFTLAAFAALAIAGPAAAGSAVLTWEPPTENTDGTPLEDLAGYRIRWGCTGPGVYAEERVILHAGLRSFEVQALPNSGTCYFSVHAVNAGRTPFGAVPSRTSAESTPSNEATKVMTAADPPQPYTRSVDVRPFVAPFELLEASRMFLGFVGDPLELRLDATSGATRAELRARFLQSGETILHAWTGPTTTWAAPFAGLWELEVRSCNAAAASSCGGWRNAREDNAVFWFKLKAPTGGGIDP